MNILVINAGSSSLKYQLINMDGEKVIAKGGWERIGIPGSFVTHKYGDGKQIVVEKECPDHKAAFETVIELLTTGEGKVIDSLREIDAVGHRAVHGGEYISSSVLVDDKVLKIMDECSDFAPLHNPPEISAIKACQELFGSKVPNVAVFDTAFHQTMPKEAFIYALPYEYYSEKHIRKYGFHGTSHNYVSQHYYELYGGRENSKIVTCHLGNGSSCTAILNGKSIDTSMGFTPVDGLVMGTRSGCVDPSVITYIMQKENMSCDEMNTLLNKKSGFLGVSGSVFDNRDLYKERDEKGSERAALALKLLNYQVKKYIGAYAAIMGGLDAVLFAGGIGENDAFCRYEACSGLEFLGLKVDLELSKKINHGEGVFSTEDSRVRAMVIPTNEEIMIARDTRDIISKL